MNSSDDRYAIRSVDRAFDIIDVVAARNGELGVDQIVAATGLPKTTAFRVLATLCGRRFLERDEATQTYRLGMGALIIGSRALGDLDLRRAARSHLEQLMATTGETVHLSILSNDSALCIDKIDASRSMRMASFVGFLDPLHCSGVGKALLAFQDDATRAQLLDRMRLERHTAHTLTDRAALEAQIAEIRARGVAIDDEEIEEGLRCVAAPIHDHSGGVIAALSISGPITRVSEASLDGIVAAVRDCADAISRELGAPQGQSR